MRAIRGLVAIGVVTIAACGKKPESAQSSAADSAGKMAGMPMAMQGMTMMPMMRAHQDLASRMMDAMGADRRGMGMKPDSAWAALSDSLRQDLADLPGLSDAALKTRMQGHIGRMQRMIVMHAALMKM